MRILLVEDNVNNCLLIRDYLGNFGYDVCGISDSRAFFTMMAAFQPDLVIMDLKMPHVDGFTLLAQLREGWTATMLPVIVLSALTFRKHQERSLRLGANRFLCKPVEPSVLLSAVQEELDQLYFRRRNWPRMNYPIAASVGEFYRV
ncbi:MAG: response regulator transcription factor [Synechococcales bacterium]|nr:response regulator transcription factor [Synechococcales bacterium]